jgi:ribosome assembly protein 1
LRFSPPFSQYHESDADNRDSLLDDLEQQPSALPESASRDALIVRDFCDKIAYAFQLATAQGPLCQEPIQGTAVFLEEIQIDAGKEEIDLGRLTGETIRLVRESISQGFLDWSPRIMLAMYSCEIQASSTFLSPLTFSQPNKGSF